jgi:hypothetical protein
LKQVVQDTPAFTIEMPMPMPEPHTTMPLSSFLICSATF